MRAIVVFAVTAALVADEAAAQIEVCNAGEAPITVAMAPMDRVQIRGEFSKGGWVIGPRQTAVVTSGTLNQSLAYYHYVSGNHQTAGRSFCLHPTDKFDLSFIAPPVGCGAKPPGGLRLVWPIDEALSVVRAAGPDPSSA
jgi:hypothetical protein